VDAQVLQTLRNIPRKSKSSAQQIREEFATYFTSNGALTWQNDYAQMAVPNTNYIIINIWLVNFLTFNSVLNQFIIIIRYMS